MNDMYYKIEDVIYVVQTHVYGRSLFAKRDFKKDEIVFIAFGPLTQKATRYTIPIDWNIAIDPTLPAGNMC